MDLAKYLDDSGSGVDLARALGVTPTSVSEWKTRRKTPDPGRCVEIERATDGAVTRMDLRPDDWHRIWPELAAMHPERVPAPTPAPAEPAKAA